MTTKIGLEKQLRTSTQIRVRHLLAINSPLLSSLGENVLFNIVSEMRHAHFPKGYLFNNCEQIHEYFYILLKGRVKICRYNNDDGRELVFFLLGEGENFNTLSLIDGDPLDDDLKISAVDDIEVLFAPVPQWLAWLGEFPGMRESMQHMVIKQIGELRELASEVVFDNTKTRLVNLLLRYFDTSSYGLRLIDDLSQEELANMVGSVRPVVARLLSELRREGAIDRADGRLTITDYNKLKTLAKKNLIIR